MASIVKAIVGIISAITGFVVVTLWAPFGDRFDYATATMEEKQKYLERKARNFSRGFGLTAAGKSEISNTFVDAEYDLVSLTIQLKDPNTNYIPYEESEKYRRAILTTACTLTERKLFTETKYTMRIRIFQPNGSKLTTIEANGENCAPYFS